jgi:BMFP domain-containing protein YqiC
VQRKGSDLDDDRVEVREGQNGPGLLKPWPLAPRLAGGLAPFALNFGFPYKGAMQSQNPFLDEFAKLTNAAVGLAQAAGEEAKSAFRAQADKMATDFDLIRRDEYEALKAEVAALRDEVAALKAAKASGAKS